MTVPILILAAGASTRMNGRDKLLMEVDGVALLRHVVGRAAATGHPVLVTLPAGDVARREVLKGLNVQMLAVEGAEQGMSRSLHVGLQVVAPDCAGLLVALADMPDITSDDYLNIINAFNTDTEENIQRAAAHDGTAGNPVLLPEWALKDVSLFKGDAGARELLRQNADKVRLVRLPGDHAITDLDTPEDWAAWREREKNRQA